MSEPFRDRTDGAIARRQDLLIKRRDEFVTMPHAIRRVIVARAARKAAALAMIFSGVAMITVSISRTLASQLAGAMPGINPAPISTMVGAMWIVALVAYAVSRGRSEHRFAVEMMSYVNPGKDLDHDIERLSHEHPDEVARRMAHRLEVASAALPVVAAAFVLPATLVYLAHGIAAKGWPSTAAYEHNLGQVGYALVVSAIAGLVAGLVMTRKSMRTVAATITLLAAAGTLYSFFERELLVTWGLTLVASITLPIALVNRSLAKERIAIEATDPAAGSELWTLRGFIDSCKGVFASVRRHVTPSMVVGAGALGLLLVCAGDPVTSTGGRKAAAAGMPGLRKGGPISITSVKPGVSSATVDPTGDGRLRVQVTIVDGQLVELSDLSGMTHIPTNWRARVTVRLETTDLPSQLAVTPFPNDESVTALHLGKDATEHRFSTETCDVVQPLGLKIVPDADWPKGTYHATLLVEPTLELSTCNGEQIQRGLKAL
jgi:hypothetical protein